MSNKLFPQTAQKAAAYFKAEPAAVSLIGELGDNARFTAERQGGTAVVKFFVKGEGAGFALVETLELPIDPSKGSLGVIAGLEYFLTDGGDLYRASVTNPLGALGYRQGARWQCPAYLAQSQFELIKSFSG